MKISTQNSKKNLIKFKSFIGAFLMSAVLIPNTAISQSSPAPINLGTAANYVVLAKSGISTTGTTAITGHIGVSPNNSTSITGFGLILHSSGRFATSSLLNGQAYAADYAPSTPSLLTTAVSDMQTAYTEAAGRPADYNELHAGNLTGQTLSTGVYKWTNTVSIDAGGVTISGSSTDVWIFEIADNLTVANGAIVTLSGGAKASNIFWQVAGQTTLGTTSQFKGNVLCQTLIDMQNGSSIDGRVLAQTAVTLNATSISNSGLSALGSSTQLALASCGTTGFLRSSYIYATPIEGAGNYKFTFSNGQTFTTGNYKPQMLLNNISGLQYGQTYGVTVQAQIGGVFTTAGAVCSITLAAFPTTQLTTLSCNATGLTPTSTIYCNAVAGATKYQFVFNGVTSYTTTNDSPRMALNSISSLQYGQTYAVTVKAYAGGVWGTVGSSCDITLTTAPTSQLTTSCGQSVTKTSIIYASRIAGGYRYRFNVTDGGTYTRSFTTGNDFPQTSLTNFPGLLDGQSYVVTVQAYVGGVWGVPGAPCSIFVGGLLRSANNEEVAVVENNNEMISQEVAQVITDEMITEEVKTAPAVEETSAVNVATKAEFRAYPNPVSKSSVLNISFNTEEIGKVILTDITGRIITEQNFNTNLNSVVEIDLADKKLDNGIYNLSIIGNKSTSQKTIVVVE
ncbi:MAG: ice-binding family protein [Bacteroidota bacterium]